MFSIDKADSHLLTAMWMFVSLCGKCLAEACRKRLNKKVQRNQTSGGLKPQGFHTLSMCTKTSAELALVRDPLFFQVGHKAQELGGSGEGTENDPHRGRPDNWAGPSLHIS